MTPFKKKQHKYFLFLGIPLILAIIFIFYSRLVAYYSEPLYLEGVVSQCEYKNYSDSRPIYLTIMKLVMILPGRIVHMLG